MTRPQSVFFESGDVPHGDEGRSDAAPSDHPEAATDELSEELEAIESLHDTLLRYPMAAQAAFSALVAEGRRFAETPEGARMLADLGRSKQTARARVLWEVLTTSSMTEKPTGVLPGVFLDKLARTLVVDKLEPMLARLFERRL